MTELNLQIEGSKNKKSVNLDFYQPLVFDNNTKIIPISDITNTVNTYQVFEDERNSCNKYRLNVTLNPIMSNVLANKLTEITPISGGTSLTGETRLNAIQTINDSIYAYKLGYDIFDNNFMRLDTFRTGSTLNSFTGPQLYGISSIEKTIKDNLVEENGWLGVTNKTKINGVKMFPNRKPCEKIDLFPTREHLSFKPIFINGSLKDNWDFILTYPYEKYDNNTLVKSETGLAGIPIISNTLIVYNGNKYLEVKTAYKHGLNSNDVIKIKTNANNNTYLVYDIGDINKLNQDYTIIIDADKYQDLIQLTGRTDCRLVRVVNKIDSEYYIRKFRKLPNFSDSTDKITEDNIESKILSINPTGATFLYDGYQPGFARNIFNDPIYQLQYIDDIDINLLKDNLGRPLTEIYLTVIKKNIVDDSQNEPSKDFTKIISGIEGSNGTIGYSNIKLLNNTDNLESPLEYNITITGATIEGVGMKNSFLGDIVEYNKSLAKEVILDEVKYRFNTTQREEPNNFIYQDIFGDQANLLYNSSFILGDDYWAGNKADIAVSGNQEVVGGDTVSYLRVTGQTIGEESGCYHTQLIIYEKGKTYNITFWARAQSLGLTLDKVGLDRSDGIGSYSFPLTTSWQQYNMTIVGDGNMHALVFYTKILGTSKIFDITKIKVEKNNVATNWLPYPAEGVYKFINKTIALDPLLEGYYYKPHYRIQLKNYSSVVSTGELPLIQNCEDFVSGITTQNIVKILSQCTDNEVKGLILKVESITGLNNRDVVRITNNSNNVYANMSINIYSSIDNLLIIPYNTSYFGTLSGLTAYDYTIRRYSNESTPKYCQDNYNGNCLWREILKEGIFDSESIKTTESIFTNGRIYLSESFNFYLKRQDPFGYYNLRRENFPADLYGNHDIEKISNNIIQKPNNIC